ncbi:MAG TPA: FMN-binding protein [Streptosporangiaceae bacterium]|nr:FMN-binding protein [Streptosporangiaceae bacterium]
MRRAPWLVLGGAVAGFLGVLGLHRPAGSSALPHATPPPTAARAGASTRPAAGPTAAAGSAAAPVTGPVVPYGYGELDTRVTISGGRITAVTVPVLKTAEQFSRQLATQAIPVLRNEVLAAQSAHIQAVSGATYTSAAYARSVQAALDKAHFR